MEEKERYNKELERAKSYCLYKIRGCNDSTPFALTEDTESDYVTYRRNYTPSYRIIFNGLLEDAVESLEIEHKIIRYTDGTYRINKDYNPYKDDGIKLYHPSYEKLVNLLGIENENEGMQGSLVARVVILMNQGIRYHKDWNISEFIKNNSIREALIANGVINPTDKDNKTDCWLTYMFNKFKETERGTTEEVKIPKKIERFEINETALLNGLRVKGYSVCPSSKGFYAFRHYYDPIISKLWEWRFITVENNNMDASKERLASYLTSIIPYDGDVTLRFVNDIVEVVYNNVNK